MKEHNVTDRVTMKPYTTRYPNDLNSRECFAASSSSIIVVTNQICNNDATVIIVNQKLTSTDMLAPEADILLACQKCKYESACLINLRWERGHQDKGKKYKDIPKGAQLNVDLDHLVKDTRFHHTTVSVTPYPSSGTVLIICRKISPPTIDHASKMH